MSFQAIVMAGGSGTRFWPLSRRRRPKQVLALAAGQSLIAATLARLAGGGGTVTKPWICCGPALEPAIRDALGEFEARFVIEPEARDTAPCVALSLARVLAETAELDTVAGFMPADHVIEPAARFREIAAVAAAHAAREPRIVVLGITPSEPATGYGYIEHGTRIATERGIRIDRVASFREKPCREDAEAWLAHGGFSWNGGFVFARIRVLLAELEQHAPELGRGVLAMRDAFVAGDPAAAGEVFRSLPKISFDYAVLERSRAVDVVVADFAWNDLGSFAALRAVSPADGDGNVEATRDGLSALLAECRNTIVAGNGEHVVAALGVDGLVIVHTPDVTLVCPQDRCEEVRKLVEALRERGREDLL